MSFAKYPEYKDSGVEWLGEVPIHWEVSPFKWLLDRNDGGVWGDDPDGTDDTLVLRSTEQTVDGRWRLESAATRKLSTTEREAALLELGDLVVTKSSGSSLHIGKTTLVTDEIAQLGCCYSNFMQRLRMKPSFSPSLAWYILNNDIARLQFDLLSNSTTGLANLNGTMIGQIMLVIPPREEQTAIATFLDHETAKIDALVAEQEKLIALLQEKRQAVISHAVTKGLNPSAPMKDSGVEWLGEVPAHWVVTALKRHWTATDCKHVTAEFVEDGIPLASIREVQSRWVELQEAKRTTEHFYQLLIEGGRDPRPGDLIFSRNATVGEVAQVHRDHEPFAMGQDVVLLRRIEETASPDFLQLVLRSSVVTQQLALCMVGSTFKRINVEEIRSLVIAFPPSDEQTKIANHLLAQAESFDSLMTEARTAITLLQERRTALISAAVTGQIDVRGWVPADAASNFIAASAGAESVGG